MTYPGRRPGSKSPRDHVCKDPDCETPITAAAYNGSGLCKTCLKRQWRLRNLGGEKRVYKRQPTNVITPYPEGLEMPKKTRDTEDPNWNPYEDPMSYNAVRKHLRKYHGSPSAYACVGRCGREAQAWAYDYGDPLREIVTSERGQIVVYSPDPAYYEPMCQSCANEERRIHRGTLEEGRAVAESVGS